MEKWLSVLYRRLQAAISFAGPSLLDQAIVSGLNFLVGIYLAYAIGMGEFGQFSLILVITFFCLEMQRAYVTAPMMTFAAKIEEGGYVRAVHVLMIVVAVLMAALAAGFVKISGLFFPMWGIAAYALPTLGLVFSRMAQEFMRRYLFMSGRPYFALAIDIVVSVAIVGGLLYQKIFGHLNVYNVIGLHAFAYMIGYAVALLPKKKNLPMLGEIRHAAERHWLFGRWLVAGVVATYASSNLLLLTGSAMLGSEAAGLIKTAQYLMGGMIVLFQAMENVIPFRMAQLANGPMADLKVFLLHALAGMMVFCTLHGLVIFAFLKPVILWISPDHQSELYPIAVANIFFTAVLVVTYCLQYLLRALEQTKPIFWANTLTAVFSLVCGGFFIRQFGVIGITFGLFVIQWMVQAVCVYASRSFWFGAR